MSVLVLPLDLAKAVKRGAKTVHRIKPTRGRVRPELGESLPIQVRTDDRRRKTLCRVEVLDLEHGKLQEVTEPEWRADGHESRGAYFAWWRETVERVEPPAAQDEPYGDVPVWVVRFQLDTRVFLSPRPGVTDADEDSLEARGYTSNPGGDAGVDLDTLEDFAQRNRERFAELNPNQSDEDEARRLARQIKEVRKRASRTGLDVTLEVAVIQHQIAEIQRRLDEAA